MIDQSLELLRNELNTFIRAEHSLTQDKVNISGLIKQDGKLDGDLEIDSMSIMLIGIQEESAIQSTQKYIERDGAKYRISPSVYLNLQVLIVFNFTHHVEALKFLSATLKFFQGRPLFDATNTTSFSIQGIEKLKVKYISQTPEQQNHMWGFIGAKYMPSLLYKVSMLTIQDDRVLHSIPSVKEIQSTLVRT